VRFRGGTTRGAKTGSWLFAAYACASLISVGALGGVLLNGYREDAVSQGRDQGLAQAAVIEEMAVAPALDGADLSAGLTSEQRDRLQMATDLALFNGSVIRMRLRSFAGRVVFSDDGSTAGGVSVSAPEFQTAAGGKADVAIVADSTRTTGKVIRVLQPVVTGTSGRSIGVLELYLPYETIAAHLAEQTRRAYERLGAGLAGLYVVLGLISWSTTRALRRQALRHEYEARHDALTGLPNRSAFHTRAAAALDRAGRDQAEVAFALVDLNRFKEVNDTLGHAAGDQVLEHVALMLSQAVRGADTVTRYSGDEFVVMIPCLEHPAELVAVAERVRSCLAGAVTIAGRELRLGMSVGQAETAVPADADSAAHKELATALLLAADQDIYRVKTEMRGAVGAG